MATKHVLDTHALVWYLEGNPRLGSQAKSIIDQASSELVLPMIALAEAAFIVEIGRTSIPRVDDLIASVLAEPRLHIYPLDWNVFELTLKTTVIPEMHDRQIVATALYLESVGHTVNVLSKDATITTSGLVQVIW